MSDGELVRVVLHLVTLVCSLAGLVLTVLAWRFARLARVYQRRADRELLRTWEMMPGSPPPHLVERVRAAEERPQRVRWFDIRPDPPGAPR